jgi:beta-lactamase class D
VGWVEENNHPYFFVLNSESAVAPQRGVTVQMVKDMLKLLGFFNGNM